MYRVSEGIWIIVLLVEFCIGSAIGDCLFQDFVLSIELLSICEDFLQLLFSI